MIKEWRKLVSNKIVVGVLIVVILVPSFYSVLFLRSMWDPYSQIDQLAVAVVNEDVPVEYNGEIKNIGKDVVNQLKNNDALDFHFVDAGDAQKGLEKGDYYMTITIPEDFSENATTLVSDNPQKLQLYYSTNPGYQYTVSKLVESAYAKLETAVSQSISEAFVTSVADQFGKMDESLSAAAEGENELTDGAKQLADGNGKVTEGLGALGSNMTQFSSGADQLQKGTEDLSKSIPKLSQGINGYTAGVNSASEGAEALYGGIKNAAGGIDSVEVAGEKLYGGLSGISNEKLDALAGGASKTAGGLNDINAVYAGLVKGVSDNLTAYESSGDAQALAASKQYLEQLSALSISINELSEASNQVSQGTGELSSAVKAARDGSGQLLAGIQQVQQGFGSEEDSETLLGGSYQLTAGLNQLEAGGRTLNGSIPALSQGAASLNGGAKALNSGAGEIEKGVGALYDGSAALGDGIDAMIEGSELLSAGLEEGAEKISDAGLKEDQIEMISAPVESKESYVSTISDNGSSMAAYMMVIAMWMGCMAFFMAVDLKKVEQEVFGSSIRYYINKSAVIYPVSIAIAVLMVLSLCCFNGFDPYRFAGTMITAIVASVCFMSVGFLLMLICDFEKTGNFLMMVFMIVNLSISCGVYSRELSPPFVNVLTDYSPFTYTVRAFRVSVSGLSGLAEELIPLVIMMAVAVFISLAFLTVKFAVKRKRILELDI